MLSKQSVLTSTLSTKHIIQLQSEEVDASRLNNVTQFRQTFSSYNRATGTKFKDYKLTLLSFDDKHENIVIKMLQLIYNSTIRKHLNNPDRR